MTERIWQNGWAIKKTVQFARTSPVPSICCNKKESFIHKLNAHQNVSYDSRVEVLNQEEKDFEIYFSFFRSAERKHFPCS